MLKPILVMILVWACLGLAPWTGAQETAESATEPASGSAPETGDETGDETAVMTAEPALELIAIEVTPERPDADSLCRLRAVIANRADRPISALKLAVTIDGEPVPVYDDHWFLEILAPGTDTEIELFNFWTSEGRREATAGGQLTVRVELEAARFVARTIEADRETIEIGDPVEGLPAPRTLTVPIAPKSSAPKSSTNR